MNNNQRDEQTVVEEPILRPKLKPVTFLGGGRFFSKNEFQQNLLLKALQVTTNPQELRKMIGVKTVADVYRTLDKLAIRKEFHAALADHGLTPDYIVGGIKKIVEDPNASSAVKLKSLQALLKSIGLEKYEEQADTGKSWEELLLKLEDKPKELPGGKYEVDEPPMPEAERVRRESDRKVADNLYGKK